MAHEKAREWREARQGDEQNEFNFWEDSNAQSFAAHVLRELADRKLGDMPFRVADVGDWLRTEAEKLERGE